MSEESFEEMAYHEWMEYEQQINDNNVKMLKVVESKVTSEAYKEILQELDISENTFDYKIVDKPKGEIQKFDENEHIVVYVNQTTNGGYTGDEFAGTVSIKLNETEFFQYSYSM